MKAVITRVAENLGPTPRRFRWWDRFTYLGAVRPRGIKHDPLRRWFDGLPVLLKHGRVTWGRTIQVNESLFSAGEDTGRPGEVVYVEAGVNYSSPELLEPITSALYALKGTHPDDADLCRIAEYLTDEYVRAFGWKVPRALAGSTPFRLATVWFERKHLPNRILSLPFFPLLVSPDEELAAVVPSRYWPPDFAQWWIHQEEPDATPSSPEAPSGPCA